MQTKAFFPPLPTPALLAAAPLARLALVGLCLSLATGAEAVQTLYYNVGGSMTWSTSTGDWATSSSGSGTTDWASGDSAVFDGTAATASLSGTVNVNAITFNITGCTIGSGTLTLDGSPSMFTIGGANNSSDTISSVIAGTGGLIIAGPGGSSYGSVTLSGVNTFSGGLTLSGNARVVSTASTALGASAGLVTVGIGSGIYLSTFTGGNNFDINGTGWLGDGGTVLGALRLNNNVTVSGNVTLAGSARIWANASSQVGTVSGVISDGGSGYALDTGGNATTATLILSGANTYGGATTISKGVLELNNALALQNSTLTMSGAGAFLFDSAVSGKAFTLGGLAASASGTGYDIGLTNTSSHTAIFLTVGNNNANTTYAGILSAAGSLTKVGTGTLMLAAANMYSGNTTINAGTLALGAAGSINNSPLLSMAAGATFDVSANSAFSLSSSTTLSASGTGTTVGTSAAAINGAAGGSVSLGSSSIILTYDGSDPALYISQGTLSLNGNPFTVNTAAPLAVGTYTLVQQASGNITTNGTFTVGGTAIGQGYAGAISVSGGNVILTVSDVVATQISVETAADGSGTVAPPQSLAAGSSLTVYAIARAANGAFVANVAATWALANVTGGVATGDLVPAGNGTSATFTGHVGGTAVIGATANGWTPTSSGTLTVQAGTATQVRVETAADGSGTVVPAQTVTLGNVLVVYAITRDAWTNFVANAAANSWTTVNDTGGVQNSNLSPGSGPSSTFTAGASGSGQINANISGLTSVASGLITVAPSLVVWSAAPANYQWDTTSANWTAGGGVFESGDPVQFTDSGSASSPITLVGALTPASVTVNVTNNNYIFCGSGHLAGTNSLVLNGSGTLTISNSSANTYSGGTFVNGGTLVMATTSGSQLGKGSITVASGAALVMATGVATWSNNISGTGRWQVGTGTGSQSTELDGNYSAFNGTLEVATGGAKIVLSTPANYPAASATLQLDANEAVYLAGGGTFASAIQMYGGVTGEPLGQLRLGGAAGSQLSGALTLLGNTTIGVNSGQTITISGGIGGNFGFTKLSAGSLILSGNNTYTGNTVISAGTLALGAAGSINNSASLSLAAGATFDVSAISTYNLSSNTSLSASGSGTAATIKGAGGGVVNLGASPVTLTYDGADPALTISQGTLSLEGNPFTVNTANAAPLATGIYALIQQASGNITVSGTNAITGTAIGPGGLGIISVSGGNLLLTVVEAGTTISVETAADGSGTVVSAQSLAAGSSLTVYAIARTASGAFIANVPAAWSLATLTGGVVSGNLVPAANGLSATFTGQLLGTASIRAAWAGLTTTTPAAPMVSTALVTAAGSFALSGTGSPNLAYNILASTNLAAPISNWWLVGSANATTGGTINFMDLNATNPQQFYRLVAPPATDSGLLTVVPGPATQVSVETAPDGSGTVVPVQTFASGYALTVYAVTRDASGNFVANAAATSWTMVNTSGGVQSSNLSPSSGPSSTFTAGASGSGAISANISGLTSVVSGLIYVVSESSLVWSATPANDQWDATSTNWTGGTGVFGDGDPVLFTDSGSASSPIVLVGALSPASVTVNAVTNNYLFGGSGYLKGTSSLVKNGSSTLTIANTPPNTYTGGTFVNGGVLEITTANGVNTSPITVASGATLAMDYSGITTWSNNVSGAGLWQVATGTGSQGTTLAGNYSGFTGTLEVTNGGAKIAFASSANFLPASATLQLDANETAYINVSGTFPSAINLYGGTTGEGLGQLRLYNAVTASGPVTLLADTTIGVDSGRAVTISGSIGGSFGFTKLSGGTLTLSGNNTYTGNTTVSAGTLNVNGTLGNGASTVTVAGVLAGNGTILSPVQVLSGGTLAPGAVTSYSSLTISNSLTLAGQTIMELNNAGAVLTNDAIVASGNIAFGGTLVLSNLTGVLYMGDSFTLFQGASYSGSFAHISPATPGSGLVWDTSQLAVSGVIMVMSSSATTSTYSYAGYTITARSQFYQYDSMVNRPYPLYNYSVNIDQIGNSYMAVTGGDYTGSGENGDHEFGWTSPAGRASTWSDIEGGGTSSSSSVPLFLQSNTFGANTMDPELIYNPADGTWYMYVQKQRSGGDQIMALTSTDRKNWTAHTSRSVVINIPSSVVFQHEEVIYVPWSSTPFWLYAYLEVSGVQKGYKLFKSNDPLTFDYNAQKDSGGERNTGGQRGYLQEAASGPLFVRITEEGVGPNGANVPIIQFSNDGTSWTYGGWVVLAGSTNTGNYGNCFFPGISTINGNGAVQYLGHNRWRAIYAATTAVSDTAPNILNSEIGCGVVILDLN